MERDQKGRFVAPKREKLFALLTASPQTGKELHALSGATGGESSTYEILRSMQRSGLARVVDGGYVAGYDWRTLTRALRLQIEPYPIQGARKIDLGMSLDDRDESD